SMNWGLDSEAAPPEGQPTRFAMLKKELEAAIERLPEGGKTILITFSTAANLFTPQPMTVNAQTKKKLLDYVKTELQPNGGTNIYGALKAAFDAAGLGATDKFYRPAVDTIFFLTDGTPSPDTEITDPERLLAYVRERNKLSKITVHVVCLGEADANFLRKLAAQNGGEFTKP
ncbi:MAG: VWA domain-containing protein, partial [Planctomycetota bacterium]